MEFDADKVRDEAKVLDPVASSLDRRIPDAAASITGVNAGRARLTGFGAAVEGHRITDILARTRSTTRLDSPFLRAFTGTPASGTLPGGLRPGGTYGRITSALAGDYFRQPVAKLDSLAVAESQTSAALNASPVMSVADSFQDLRSLEQSTRHWPSTYSGALKRAGFKQVSATQQTLAGHYAGHYIQDGTFLDVQSDNMGTQAVRGFVRGHESQPRPMLDAFNTPIVGAISKFVAGFTMLAQRIGGWIKGVFRPFGEVFEWLRREIERWPRDPYGNPVLFWNVRLYRLAQAAYEGDYAAKARFLDVIEADGSPENVLMIEELLKPTFDPQRLDRRVGWEQMDPLSISKV